MRSALVLIVGALIAACATTPAEHKHRLPIIDMHLHAEAVAEHGPPPKAICAPFMPWPRYDVSEPPGAYAMRYLRGPECENPLWSPESDEALMRESLAALERHNVYAVTSGTAEMVKRWQQESPDRIMPALRFLLTPDTISVEELRKVLEKKEFVVFGEVVNQYLGITPDDPRFEPYVALLEELDVPLAIHLGPGPPGTPLLEEQLRDYKASLHNPLTLEPLLRKHPRLRVYAMHAGWPMLDEMIAMLYTYPQLYVDISILAYAFPPEEFYRYLERLVSAGFGKRVMWGSDQMSWPQAIEIAINRVEAAPFLTAEQKRDIFYNNAARFLRLSDEVRARHHLTGQKAAAPGAGTSGRP